MEGKPTYFAYHGTRMYFYDGICCRHLIICFIRVLLKSFADEEDRKTFMRVLYDCYRNFKVICQLQQPSPPEQNQAQNHARTGGDILNGGDNISTEIRYIHQKIYKITLKISKVEVFLRHQERRCYRSYS